MLILVILAFVLLVLPLADASTETRAFSRSYLFLNDSSDAVLKTISQNSLFYMPGLYIKGYGEAEMAARSEASDILILEQAINHSTTSSRHLGIVSSHVWGRNLTELDVSLSGIYSTGLYCEGNLSLVKSESSGLGLAYPGEGDYAFFLNGGHYLKLDFSDLPHAYAENILPSEVSFQGDELILDEPADFIDQRVDLIYSLSPDYQSSYRGYSLYRSMEDDGVKCQSEMEYGVVSN